MMEKLQKHRSQSLSEDLKPTTFLTPSADVFCRPVGDMYGICVCVCVCECEFCVFSMSCVSVCVCAGSETGGIWPVNLISEQTVLQGGMAVSCDGGAFTLLESFVKKKKCEWENENKKVFSDLSFFSLLFASSVWRKYPMCSTLKSRKYFIMQ